MVFVHQLVALVLLELQVGLQEVGTFLFGDLLFVIQIAKSILVYWVLNLFNPFNY